MLTNKFSEQTIEDELIKFYSKKKKWYVQRQVKLSQKRIDVVAFNPQFKEILAIEIKIRDWKCALRQAYVNTLICNRSYVALWHKYAKQATLSQSLFGNLGIGLMVINHDYVPELIFEAKQVSDINPEAYKHFCSNFYAKR